MDKNAMEEKKNLIVPKQKKLKTMEIVFIIVMLAYPVFRLLFGWIAVNLNSILMAFQTPQGEWSTFTLKRAIAYFQDGGSDLLLGIKNTLLFFAKDMVMFMFHILIAYFLYKRVCGYKQIRVFLYLPSIISSVAIITMFSNFIAPTGPIGLLLRSGGVENVPEFLANSKYATWTVMFYTIWIGWGGDMLLLGGTFARIPIELIESARLDGIKPFREIVSIMIPLITPTLVTMLILKLTGLINSGGPILLFTNGYYGTMTFSFWMFQKIYYDGYSAYNLVSAVGLIVTIIYVPFILITRWLLEKLPVAEY